MPRRIAIRTGDSSTRCRRNSSSFSSRKRDFGGYISRKIASAEWGDGVVDELAATIAREYPGQRGFTRANLFRMRQFFEAYQGDAKVSALLRQFFCLEALDRDVKKPHERPSIGVLLCASKDNDVVEYALSRSLSPTLVAEYQTTLPSKALLRRKLHELYAQLVP